jgi:flagellar protein FlbD
VITLHKLNGDRFVLNADLIISVEANPDTLISMVDRRTLLVREEVADVIGAVIDYRRAIAAGTHLVPVAGGAV